MSSHEHLLSKRLSRRFPAVQEERFAPRPEATRLSCVWAFNGLHTETPKEEETSQHHHKLGYFASRSSTGLHAPQETNAPSPAGRRSWRRPGRRPPRPHGASGLRGRRHRRKAPAWHHALGTGGVAVDFVKGVFKGSAQVASQ